MFFIVVLAEAGLGFVLVCVELVVPGGRAFRFITPLEFSRTLIDLLLFIARFMLPSAGARGIPAAPGPGRKGKGSEEGLVLVSVLVDGPVDAVA